MHTDQKQSFSEDPMRDHWQRSKKSTPRGKANGRRGQFIDDPDGGGAQLGSRRSSRKRQLEELTEIELEEMLDSADSGERVPE